MAPIASRLGPITSGVQPIFNALGTQIPVLSDVIGGDTSLLGLADRFGGADLGFLQAVSAVATMVDDITRAVDYINQHPDESYLIPLGGEVTFATDFRSTASSQSKPKTSSSTLPNQQQSVTAMNSYLGQYEGAARNNFTESAKKVLNANSSYGVSGGLGISFDVLSSSALIDMLTGQTTNLFTMTFPKLAANFSIDASFPIAPPLSMTFGGGVNASAQLGIGMSTAGLEVWADALQKAIKSGTSAVTGSGSESAVSFEDFLSPKALEQLALDVIQDGLFVDATTTRIQAGGGLTLGAQLNGGAAKAGVDGHFNVDMIMTPNAGPDGRLTLSEMIQLAGDNFSSPLNLFNFEFVGSISADAYLKFYLPFKWRTIWSHDFGSFTVFDVKNNPAPPTESAASLGSLFLNIGPTASRGAGSTIGIVDEHVVVRHVGGVAGNETVSVQSYVDGVAQYVDAEGKPQPQIYTGVDTIVGFAGDGDDIIDCTGVLSPVRIDGGGGDDTILGGLGINILHGSHGSDSITGGGTSDTLSGGPGNDIMHVISGESWVNGGGGSDAFLPALDGPMDCCFAFDDSFGGDSISTDAFADATLDFSQVTKPMTLTLGAAGGVSVGGSHVVSWSGKGPKKIILGSGQDQVTFAPGYESVEIDFGPGGSTVEILAFEPDTTVSLVGLNPQEKNSLNVCALAATSLTVSADGLTTSDGSRIAMDVSHLRKLTFHDPAADVVLDFAGAAPARLQVSARTASIVSALQTTDLRITGAEGVRVDGQVAAAGGGSVLLATTRPGAAVTIGQSAATTITTARGNVAIMGSKLVIGGLATTPFSISGGGLDNKAGSVSPPAGRVLVGSRLLGPGGDYSGMYLAGRDLAGVDLTGANLTGADLSGADLTGANLSAAVIANTKLAGVNLAGARIHGAVFSGASGEPAALPAGWTLSGGVPTFGGIDIPAGQIGFLSERRTGSDQLVKSGDGILIVPLANSHSGGTFVEAGTLYIRNAGGLGSGSLAVGPGAKVVFDVDAGPIPLTQLTVSPLATLDVGTGSLVVGPGGYDLAMIRQLITSARGNGTWTGAGITSRSVQGAAFRGVGYRVLPDGSLVIGYAAVGDANLDGYVNSLDLVTLNTAGAYGASGSDPGWWQGDFNYDGRVSIPDLVLMASSGLYGGRSYLPNTVFGLESQDAVTSSPTAVSLTGVTLTGSAAPESPDGPLTSHVSRSDAASAVRRPPLRRADQFAWLAQTERERLAQPTDRKTVLWRRVAE
jgi:autotransporter-associated beta strand protein